MVGLLVGVACSDEVESVAAAATDAVLSFTAADVPYDDDRTIAQAIEDLQEQLDQVGAHEERLVALENQELTAVDILFYDTSSLADVPTVQKALDRLFTRVDTAHHQSAADIAVEPVGSIVGSNAQTVFEVLSARIAALETRLLLAEQHLAFPVCPPGFLAAGATCIEEEWRSPTFWHGAVSACNAEGAHICLHSEYMNGCSATGGLESPAMTGLQLANDVVVTALPGTGCSYKAGTADPLDFLYQFRCCRNLGLQWAK